MMIRRHYWFSGRVQGVGFRYKAYYIARSLGVTGWVRNNWDDRVEMEAQGTGEDLDQMVQMLNEQHFICIENIEMETIEIEEEHSFYVKYGLCSFCKKTLFIKQFNDLQHDFHSCIHSFYSNMFEWTMISMSACSKVRTRQPHET